MRLSLARNTATLKASTVGVADPDGRPEPKTEAAVTLAEMTRTCDPSLEVPPMPGSLHRLMALVVLAGSAARPAMSDETESPSALEQDPSGWTDLLAQAGPELKGWTRGPIPPRASSAGVAVVDRPGDRPPRVQGDGGHDWLRWDQELGDFASTTSSGGSPRSRGRRGTTRGSTPGTRPTPRSGTRPRPATARAASSSATRPSAASSKRVNLSKELLDKRVRPAGEWNTFEITCKGRDMTLWVNGAVTCEWHDVRGPQGLRRPGGRGLADRVPQREGQADGLTFGRARLRHDPPPTAPGGAGSDGASPSQEHSAPLSVIISRSIQTLALELCNLVEGE